MEKALNQFQRLVKIEPKNDIEDLLYITGDTQKDKIYHFREFKTMWSLGLVILNGSITLNNAVRDQENIKYATDNFKKSPAIQQLRKKGWKKNLFLKYGRASYRKAIGYYCFWKGNIFDETYRCHWWWRWWW